MIKQSKKNSKKVAIVARVFIKKNAAVVYIVRSSNGVDAYYTTVINGKATGCTCPAHQPCYHMVQVQQIEAERTAKVADKSYQQAIDEKFDGCYESDPRIEAEEKSLSDPWEGLDADERAMAYGYYLMSIGA